LELNIITLNNDLLISSNEVKSVKNLNDVLKKQYEDKSTEYINIKYEKLLVDQELIISIENNENSQMEAEEILSMLELVRGKFMKLEQESSKIEKQNKKLSSLVKNNPDNKKNSKNQIVQTDINVTIDKSVLTDPMDEFNEPLSLVNTLTTSLGGIATHKGGTQMQSVVFAPSPVNGSDSQSMNQSFALSNSNKFQTYLKSNKQQNRVIAEEDGDATRVSFSTKNANAPDKLNFSMRQSNLSPISAIGKPHLYKRHKEAIKKKKKLKKRIKNNMINESFQGSESSKHSNFGKDDPEMLQAVYDSTKFHGVRPMTVPHPINESDVANNDDYLKESLINIDNSHDSEFLRTQIRMRPQRDHGRGWSSKPRRKDEKSSLLNNKTVRLKKQLPDQVKDGI